jgi:hypothetical protein
VSSTRAWVLVWLGRVFAGPFGWMEGLDRHGSGAPRAEGFVFLRPIRLVAPPRSRPPLLDTGLAAVLAAVPPHDLTSRSPIRGLGVSPAKSLPPRLRAPFPPRAILPVVAYDLWVLFVEPISRGAEEEEASPATGTGEHR